MLLLLSLSCHKYAIYLAMRQSCYLIAGCALAWMWLGLWPAEQILSCWDAPLCSGWPVLARKAATMLQISCQDELENTMVQLGVTTLDELKATRKMAKSLTD